MEKATDEIIKLENVDFYYNKGMPNEMQALKKINLSVHRGEIVSFFGSSGCGKSTLLYMISGIDKPHNGKVYFNGHDITDFSAKQTSVYRQIGIGLIFQNFNLIPSLSVADNVSLPMTFLGLSSKKRREQAMKILEYLNISDLASRLPYELSGGQQQRVGIARSLANDPPLILADEPTGNLDSANAVKTMELLKEFSTKHHKTVILVTHEAWCLKYVDRIFYMKDGMITKTESVKAESFTEEEDGKGIESRLKEISPGSSKIDVMVWSLSSFLFKGYSKEETKRAEDFLRQRMSKELTYSEFLEILDRPFKEGGLGLWKQKAKVVADTVEEIIKEKHEMSVIHKKLQKNPNYSLNEEVRNISKWVADVYKGKLTQFQIDSLDECVNERIRNIITQDNFVKVLSLSRRSGGVGFSMPTALKISDRLEMLVSTGKKPS